MNIASIFTLPHILSLSRLVFAALLFVDDPYIRFFSIILAAISDFLDGFFARKMKQITPLGTCIDPLTDKCFVIVAVAIFSIENHLSILQLVTFFLRDVSLFLFYGWLHVSGSWQMWKIRSFWCGKLMTTFQFATLLFLALQKSPPDLLFYLMAGLGIGSFFELLWRLQQEKKKIRPS